MKRILLIGSFGLLLSFISVHGAWAFGLKDVVQMHGDGIADSLIIQKIDHSGKTFHLDARDMHELKQAGVSDEVISAMLQTAYVRQAVWVNAADRRLAAHPVGSQPRVRLSDRGRGDAVERRARIRVAQDYPTRGAPRQDAGSGAAVSF